MVPSAVCLFLSEFFVRSAKNITKSLQIRKIVVPLHSRFEKTGNAWEHSSVGSERLPYKQRVGGSTPSAPTEKDS